MKPGLYKKKTIDEVEQQSGFKCNEMYTVYLLRDVYTFMGVKVNKNIAVKVSMDFNGKFTVWHEGVSLIVNARRDYDFK